MLWARTLVHLAGRGHSIKQMSHNFSKDFAHHQARLHLQGDTAEPNHTIALDCANRPALEELCQRDAGRARAGRTHASGHHLPVGCSLFTRHLMSTTGWRRLSYSLPHQVVFVPALLARSGLCRCSRVHNYFPLQDLRAQDNISFQTRAS